MRFEISHVIPYHALVQHRRAQTMNTFYYDAIDQMQKNRVDPEYINGWASGFLHNPKREEQRVNEAYEAGYADGLEKNLAGFDPWLTK